MRADFWFEDLAPGQRFVTRGATLSEAQILDFAWAFDPQPFHLDKEAAAEWGFDGLIASGFQTLLVSFRLWLQERVITTCSLGSPGMDEIRWLKPVRPGDTIHLEAEVLNTRPSRSRSDRGSTVIGYTVINQAQEAVMTYRATHILRCRPPVEEHP